ncbi:MAG: hypothetical protein JHC93_08255, partial [Parachlamydiales bacterium]|nr:hypothetical protein [Parachlamydiales bacterium]
VKFSTDDFFKGILKNHQFLNFEVERNTTIGELKKAFSKDNQTQKNIRSCSFKDEGFELGDRISCSTRIISIKPYKKGFIFLKKHDIIGIGQLTYCDFNIALKDINCSLNFVNFTIRHNKIFSITPCAQIVRISTNGDFTTITDKHDNQYFHPDNDSFFELVQEYVIFSDCLKLTVLNTLDKTSLRIACSPPINALTLFDWIVTGNVMGEIHFYDFNLNLLKTFNNDCSRSKNFSFAAFGNKLMSANSSKYLSVWNSDGTYLTFANNNQEVKQIGVIGNHVVTSDDHTLKIWDENSYNLSAHYFDHDIDKLCVIDDKIVISGSNCIKILKFEPIIDSSIVFKTNAHINSSKSRIKKQQSGCVVV